MIEPDPEKRRRFENIVLAHAKVQGELLMLMLAVSGGYDDLGDGDAREKRRRLAKDAQDVVDAAVQLRRTILSAGDFRPPGVDE